jgi:hypothetical protein
MTFAFRLTRGLSLGALAATITLGGVMAQNGTNYHVLTNDADVIYSGVGAGGTSTAADGVMTVIPGEDLKGSHIYPFSGDFGYRNPAFRENICLITPPPVGTFGIKFPGILFVEMDGLNGNVPAVFTNPACVLPSFPTSGSVFMPYGTGPGSTVSFVISGVPSGAYIPLGLPSSMLVLLPDNGLVSAGAGGTATIIGGGSGTLGIPTASAGFCWAVQFTWGGTALGSFDDVDSWVHYALNSGDNNQYWMFSNDELNIWQSWSLITDSGVSVVFVLPAATDYTLLMSTIEPNTTASLAPVGLNASGPYYTQTENVANENGVIVNPNGGFDAGRGSRIISMGGSAGVPNPSTGVGNQNPGTSGFLPSLGFATWDNFGDGDGSVRLVWASIDFLGLFGGNPDTDPGVVKPFYSIRIPVVSAGLTQPTTALCWGLFGHETAFAASGWPDAGGLTSGAFGIPAIGGASWQLPTTGVSVCPSVIGVPVNLTYGTTGRKDGPGKLTFNPAIADTSGAKELFLFD